MAENGARGLDEDVRYTWALRTAVPTGKDSPRPAVSLTPVTSYVCITAPPPRPAHPAPFCFVVTLGEAVRLAQGHSAGGGDPSTSPRAEQGVLPEPDLGLWHPQGQGPGPHVLCRPEAGGGAWGCEGACVCLVTFR